MQSHEQAQWTFKNNAVLIHYTGLAFIKRPSGEIQMDEAMALIHRARYTSLGMTIIEIKHIQSQLYCMAINLFEGGDLDEHDGSSDPESF